MGTILRVPVYGTKVHVFTCRKAYKRMVRRKTRNDGSSKGMDGVCLPNGCRYFVGIFDRKISTLVHELTHVAMFEAVRTNFHIDNSNDEALAYLMGYLTTAALAALPELTKA